MTITKNGVPAALIVDIDEWEALQETLNRLSQEGTLAVVNESRREVADDGGLSEQQIRARFGTQRTA